MLIKTNSKDSKKGQKIINDVLTCINDVLWREAYLVPICEQARKTNPD